MNLPRELGLRMEIAFWNMISQYIKKLYLDGAQNSASYFTSKWLRFLVLCKFSQDSDFLDREFENYIYICSFIQLLTCPFLFSTVLSINYQLNYQIFERKWLKVLQLFRIWKSQRCAKLELSHRHNSDSFQARFLMRRQPPWLCLTSGQSD